MEEETIMRRKSLAVQFHISNFSCVVFEHGVSPGDFGFGFSSLVVLLYSTTIMQERTGERDTRENRRERYRREREKA